MTDYTGRSQEESIKILHTFTTVCGKTCHMKVLFMIVYSCTIRESTAPSNFFVVSFLLLPLFWEIPHYTTQREPHVLLRATNRRVRAETSAWSEQEHELKASVEGSTQYHQCSAHLSAARLKLTSLLSSKRFLFKHPRQAQESSAPLCTAKS